MLRRLIFCFGVSLALAWCNIWPDQIAEFRRVSRTAVTPPSDRALWQEYGLQEAEQAEFEAAGAKFAATAYRLNDPTGAMAAYQWQRPAGSRPSELEKLAVETADGAFLAFGNYLFAFRGKKPSADELQLLFAQLPRLDQSALPSLGGFLPAKGLIAGSERFVIGPASLEKFQPAVSPSLAGFHLSVEAQLARYQSPAGELGLAIFSYPTQHIARERVEQFQKLPGVLAKRTGPLVALIVNPADADEAQKLLALVNYQATITWSEAPPQKEPNVAEMLIAIFSLIGVLLLAALLAGLGFGGVRQLVRKWTGRQEEEDSVILLHLGDK